MKDAVLQLAGLAYTSQEQPATGSIAAGELCTLLLTDQEVLDVVLGLHDVRSAQLCRLMPWSDPHPLKLPPPSEALARQLSQSQRSVPGQVPDDDNSLQGDPLLRVWDSMHRAMLLVLAALQSLPIRPHPQHPDPAATTHTSATSQLPPGYHRCSACLLLTLRLVICLAQHCAEQPLDKDLALARLHGTLPGLLLVLSTADTVMWAAGHPEAQAQRVQFVRCLLHLGTKLATSMMDIDPKAGSNSSGRCHPSSRGPASSRGHAKSSDRGHAKSNDTVRFGASLSAGDKLHAPAAYSYGYLALALSSQSAGHRSAKSYVFLAQAWFDVFARQEDAFVVKISITTCPEKEEEAQRQSDILSLLARFLPAFQAAVVAVQLSATIGIVADSMDIVETMPVFFLTCLSAMYVSLYRAVVKLTELMPDWRCRPAVLRAGLRVTTAGALAHHTMVSLLPYVEDNTKMPHTDSKPCWLPATVQRLPDMEQEISVVFFQVTHLWSLVLAQDGMNEPPIGPFRMDDDSIHRITSDRVAVLPSPSSPQLAPLALDLVLGMENTLQMVMRHQDMVWKWPFWNDGNLVQGIVDGYRILLALFGHVIEFLATPSVVGPAGLAAQPASWLPCGNSLVEGWCKQLLAGVCKLMDIATPASATVPLIFKIMLYRGLRGSYKLLLRGQRQAPPSMSPEAERLLSCLTLVLTAMVPQELCLALAGGLTDGVPKLPGLDLTLERERRAMGVALSKLQPEQVWTWQALAAGTPAEATLQGLLSALASLFQVQGLVTPIAPGWRHQRLTVALGEWQES
ncbi:hypothetical protein QJQ45_004998 [Haematococcus lacustris]|nr:hypothetical protein QJQ45_004998 [Haematococcus lacustris]